MIGARKETLGKPEVRPKKSPHQEMNPWKDQILQWKIGFKKPA